ncbi:MAG: ferredoxin [Proteobacteria bacterium]|nr:MAG: ferredoxin [Pseudomonadota bacterium]
MAPGTFTRINEQAAVHLQPQRPEDRSLALQALLACPS